MPIFLFFHRTFSEIALVQMEELGVEVDRVSRTSSGRSGSQAGDSGDSGMEMGGMEMEMGGSPRDSVYTLPGGSRAYKWAGQKGCRVTKSNSIE